MDSHEMFLTISRKGKTGFDILMNQFRKILQNVVLRHSRCERHPDSGRIPEANREAAERLLSSGGWCRSRRRCDGRRGSLPCDQDLVRVGLVPLEERGRGYDHQKDLRVRGLYGDSTRSLGGACHGDRFDPPDLSRPHHDPSPELRGRPLAPLRITLDPEYISGLPGVVDPVNVIAPAMGHLLL